VRISLIINGNKPAHQPALREQVERLRSLGHEVRPCVTFEDGDAMRMAGEGAAWGAELVLAAGGDGTVNGVANGLHEFAKARGGAVPRMGIIPMGTANDLANALEIPGEIPEAVEVALSGSARPVAIGTVNDRCFLNVSTGGVGAQATHEAPQESKRLLGPLAYAVTGVKKLIGLEAVHGRFSGPAGLIYDGPFLLYAVGNSERTGGGNLLTPHADPTDPFLDLCIVKEVSRLEFTKLLPALRSGEHLDDPAVLYVKASGFTVDAAEDLAVNADGEALPLSRSYRYAVSPYRLPILTRGDP
jgi:diacylglycerol kinase (ATP)